VGPDYPIAELAIHKLIDLLAAASPDAVAVRFEDSSVTYCELITRADRVAWRLIAAGVARETPVAIYLDRSAELAVAMLAVLKAGGAYVPLDPLYPSARIHAIVSEADVKIALTSATLEDAVKAAIPVCIGIGEAGAERRGEAGMPDLPECSRRRSRCDSPVLATGVLSNALWHPCQHRVPLAKLGPKR
jgi:non-ribosomal peptide synthetase component F